MKAQVINTFGDPLVFTLIDLPIPDLKPGYILIKVKATSVNPIDCKIRSGLVSDIAPAFPAILHGDVAGEVVEVGSGVIEFKNGDAVYGCAGGFRGLGGALAEFMLVDERLIAKKPLSLGMHATAALPLASITAWIALFQKMKLEKGSDILIYGGTGGVGHIAIQLAKWWGATVYTTIRREEDRAIVKSLGADEVINLQQESVADYKARLTGNRGFSNIFDTVGGENLDHAFAAAAINGSIVTITARSTHDLTPMHSKQLSLHCVLMLLPLLNNQHREDFKNILQKIASIVDAGKLKPLLDPHEYMLKDVASAHELLESGQAKGKIIITVNRSLA